MENIFEGLKDIAKYEDIDKQEFESQRELFVLEALKRNSTIIKCPHCNVTGNEPNMLRWHFDNCETVLRCCEQCNNTIPRQGIKPFLYDVKKYCNRKCYMESKKGKPPIIMTREVKEKIGKSWIGRDTTNYKKPKRKK